MKGLNMSPQVKTAIATITPLVIAAIALIFGHPITLSVASVVTSLALIAGAVVAILNVFHVPASIISIGQEVLAVLQAIGSSIPADTLARVKKLAGASTLVIGLVLGACAVLEQQACLPANTPDVISSAAACAIDVIEDVQQAPTPQLLQQTLIDCGITAADLWADISALMANAKSSDAGAAVTTKRGAAVVSDVYINHLQQWQALQSGGAQ
jgi:hypothetical protein